MREGDQMKLKRYIPHLLLLLCAMIWGFGFVAQDAIEGLGALTIGAARSFVASIFLIFTVMLFDKLGGGKRKLFSRSGIGITKIEYIGGAEAEAKQMRDNILSAPNTEDIYEIKGNKYYNKL